MPQPSPFPHDPDYSLSDEDDDFILHRQRAERESREDTAESDREFSHIIPLHEQ